MTFRELNAHFISSHRRVKCDMCDEQFNTPSSLKSINTRIVRKNMRVEVVTENSHLRANCAHIVTCTVEAEATFVYMLVATRGPQCSCKNTLHPADVL